MSLSNSGETGLLNLILINTNFANIGDATGLRGSSAAGNLYISLHTSDPGEAGDQTSNETAYTNYVRVAVVRSGSGWSVSGDTGSNVAAIPFAQCGASGATITHVGIGTASSSTGVLLFSGALSSSLIVSNGVTPSFAISALTLQFS